MEAGEEEREGKNMKRAGQGDEDERRRRKRRERGLDLPESACRRVAVPNSGALDESCGVGFGYLWGSSCR